MKKWIGLTLIAGAAAAVLVYKATSTSSGAPAPTSAADHVPRVLLFADLREIDEEHGCGDIIRSVRDVAAHGIPTRENDDSLGHAHHVTVEPTVVILDPSGAEQARFEGESGATIDALHAALAKLKP